MPLKKKKVFVIGLDGLSFDMLNQIRNKYNLKNINKLLSDGAAGPLRSVIPYSSAPNWASITTGVNPGKHGFYSFFFPKDNAYEYQFPNSTHVKVDRLWDIIGRNGKSSLVVNVPGTYPPREITGSMVTGMLTPDINSNFAYPSSLADEIRERFPDYTFDTNWKNYQNTGIDSLIEALLISVKMRRDLIFYLLEKHSIDFGIVVYTETDRLFHSALNLIDENHPGFDKEASIRNQSNIMEIFRVIDESIGEIIRNYMQSGNIILLSDHGFAPAYKRLYLNNWLLEQKLLSIRNNDETSSKHIFKKCLKGVLQILIRDNKKRGRFQEKLLYFLRGKKGLAAIVNLADSFSRMDWSKTKAYYLQEWGIRINLKGREPQGVVEKEEYENVRNSIIKSILKFKDPENNNLIIKQALKREDVYEGDEFESAPDIVLIAEDAPGYEITSDTSINDIFSPVGWKTGDHSLFGMFLIAGDNIQNRSLDNISVKDIVPTVLYTFGIPVPQYMDGKVLKEVFTQEYLHDNTIVSDKNILTKHTELEEFSDEDEEKVKDRLKGLGYL